ncbi:MAG: LysR family transcriptional regulator [Nannocystaceae bacterium]
MDLEELRSFLAVAETGSFLAAANTLGVPRATLRRRVDALEARAGALLLERSARGVVVTEAGAMLVARGRDILQEATALVSSIREIGREPVGVLRVLLPFGLPPAALASIVSLLRGAYPRLSHHIRFADSFGGDTCDEIDVVVLFGGAAAPPPGSWDSYKIFTVREWLIAKPEYLARRGTPTTLAELAGHELFGWTAPGEDGRTWPTRSGEPLEVEPALTTPDIHLIRQFVLAGLGIGLVPDALLPELDPRLGTVVPVLEDLVGRERSLYVLVPTAFAGLPKLRAVVSHVRRFVAESELFQATNPRARR